MSYSRRQLYAFGEPLGNSATRNKVGGGRIYGGGGGGDIISDVVDPIVNVVESVASPIVDVVEQVGQAAANVVETAAQTVANTAEAIVNDPMKALPLIAVAVVAPELAPLLEVSTATAGAIINTGIALANGADPTQVAENFATSMATGSLGITTGTGITDRMLVGGVNAAINGQDVSTGVGKALGNYAVSSAVSSGVSETKSAISDSTVADNTNPATGESWQGSDQGSTVSPSTAQDTTTAGFSPEELNAINQGQADAAVSGPSPYAPTAGTTTSDVPASSVVVTGAPNQTDTTPTAFPVDAFADSSSPSGYSNNAGEPVNADGTPYSPIDAATQGKSLEQLQQDLTDGKITAEQFNAAYKTSEAPISLQEYKDVGTGGGLPSDTKATSEYQDPQQGGLPTEQTGSTPNLSGVLGATTDGAGNTISTFDDGSTLTTDAKGNVVDFTEATDYVDPNASEGDGTTTTGGLGISIGKAGTRARSVRGTTGTKTVSPSSGSTDTSGLSGLGTSYGSNLTQATSAGNPEYSLFGETAPQENMASGGAVQHMATGSTPDTSAQGVYDLSTTASSPFLGSGNQSIMALKPQVIKGKINYALPGYPFGQEWKLAAEGGAIENAPEAHDPEFFSEGGLNSLQHTYLKGGGDGTSDSIPAMLANGEFVIPADVVSSLGNGSSDSGAKVLDEFLKTIRAHKRKADPKKLPPDSKGVKGYLLDAKKKVKK
jgi:hypothetical protein